MSDDVSDDALLLLVVKADESLFAAGEDIRQRQFNVPRVVMQQLGYVSYGLFGAYTPPILNRIRAQFARLYDAHDLVVGGHIGVFMFRDIFARVGIPHIYGQTAITPMEHVELTDIQKRILVSEPDSFDAYHDQFSDLFDLEYGVRELRAPYAQMELVERFLNLSRLHLHGAAAILTGGYDFRGAVQSGLLATELALKALAAANGLGEEDIRDKYGHHMDRLINDLEPKWPTFDAARARRVTEAQPRYVRNRYAKDQPKRVEVGHTVMGAQYLAGEVTRQLSDRDFKRGAGQPWPRKYPE
ncbi:hypothetical protein UB31_15145 [Bradyrhizobium sp. LTSP849]|uniref:hypothetical protein n=1 Tax=Bradyrhizobium sp. LTSP849 TaxID=1615890 RepID=UPI0005D19BEA|nr:hypothetical protein [Bradyrhizobium sp. LTSP849]KJC50002.1 hypothetical protein UB31_15145 [Bradyrhizobium sp. LTSP849]